MARTGFLLAILALTGAPAYAGDTYFHSKLDLPVFAARLRPRHPRNLDRLYIGSDRSYAQEPQEIVLAGKSLTLGMAAAGAAKASDPLSATAFLLIGLINARDISRTLSVNGSPRSDWSFIWSRNGR